MSIGNDGSGIGRSGFGYRKTTGFARETRYPISDTRIGTSFFQVALEQRMPRLPQPELAVGVEIRGRHPESRLNFALAVTKSSWAIASSAKFSGRAIFATSAVSLRKMRFTSRSSSPLSIDALGAQVRDAGRLDEERLARAARAMDDARDLVAMIDGHRQHVMIAADRGVGIAEDVAQLRIAEQSS